MDWEPNPDPVADLDEFVQHELHFCFSSQTFSIQLVSWRGTDSYIVFAPIGCIL